MYRSQYRILGLIGQGQFGRVFCAVDRQTGEIVALKDLELKRFPTHKFLREFFYLLTVRHPNIVACTGLEYNRTGRYLVMDYCEGGTLRDLINSQVQLSLGQQLNLVKNILSGLAHAHNRQIVHCDIKPENILLKVNLNPTRWSAHISDFGIARLIEEMSNFQNGGYTGSPAYMAPERFYGKHSFASDIYAVGIILFELLVGERPFSGYPGELMTAHLNKPAKIPDTIPPALGSIVEIALRKLPQRRFKNADEMLKAVHFASEKLAVHSSSVGLFVFPSYKTASSSLGCGTSSALNIIRQIPLTQQVSHLAVRREYLYLGMQNKLYCQRYSDSNLVGDPLQQWQVNLDGSLVKLYSHPQGCLTVTRLPLGEDFIIRYFPKADESWNYYNQVCSSGLGQISVIAPSGDWLAFTSSESLINVQILKLPSLKIVKTCIACPFSSQLIALDNRHGLAIYFNSEKENETIFRLFTRRGKFLATFSLSIGLHSLTSNPYLPYYLFAMEASREQVPNPSEPALGILLSLKPLKVTRIPLQINPNFILGQRWGFILANHQGLVVLLSEKGKSLGSFEIEGGISAIAICDDFQLLIATCSMQQEILYVIDLKTIIKNTDNLTNSSITLSSSAFSG